MPPDLRKAHQILDKEVLRAYGKDSTSWPNEESVVTDLIVLYKNLLSKKVGF